MSRAFNFVLNPELVRLIGENLTYSCIFNQEKDEGIVFWLDNTNHLQSEVFEGDQVKENLKDGSWIRTLNKVSDFY